MGRERLYVAEALLTAATLLTFWEIIFGAFSQAQRKAILERDNNRCQAPFPHQCDKDHLEVHHVLPQGYCEALGIDPDFAENGITICKTAHDYIHPDRVPARRLYHEDNKSFEKLHETRKKQLEQKQVYWNTNYDRQMSATAVKRTQIAQKEDWELPEKRPRQVLYQAARKEVKK